MACLEMVADKSTKKPFARGAKEVTRVAREAYRRGAMIRTSGPNIILSPALTINLLCYLNSALFGRPSRITSIRHAMGLLGMRNLRQWANLMAVLGLKPFTGSADWPQPGGWSWRDIAVQVVLGWSAISTFLAWAVYRIDKAGAPKGLRNALLVLVGYGPLLCAICLGAMVAQVRHADLKWDKTIKSGKARLPT